LLGLLFSCIVRSAAWQSALAAVQLAIEFINLLMGMFYDLVSKSPLFNPTMALGYSASEIKKIAHLYDIKISGMLYDYLSDIGRCNGGVR